MLRDHLRILGLVADRAGRSVRRAWGSPLRAARRYRITVPERLLIAPQDIRTGDPTVADDISAGYFAFGGKIVNAHGRSPFAIEAASLAWAQQLNSFTWMRHLRVADDPRARSQARLLVDAFLDVSSRPGSSTAWEPRIVARRMLAWLSQSPIILEGSDRRFYGRFMQAIAVTRQRLDRQMEQDLTGGERLLTAIALAELGLCIPGSDAFQRQGTAALAAEIKTQVLLDGGPISRNPQSLIDLMLDLLPLRQAYAARGVPAPEALLNAIDRMMPMLRLFRHGDGTLALFNGMSVTAPELVATILAYDDARALPLYNAPYSGYQRLEARDSVVIVDAGASPPQAFSSDAHAGCLSFELSSGSQRIVVNCGAPAAGRPDAREAARATAAHSTLVVNDTSSCRFASHAGLQNWLGDQILDGPNNVDVERTHDDGFTTLKLSHDGYVSRFGLLHARDLSLANTGERLEGRDVLERSGEGGGAPTPAGSLRFHLHPAVKPRLVGDGTAVVLDLPGGERWLFQADAPLSLERGVLFAASGGPRPTTQIRAMIGGRERSVVHWVFQRRATTTPSASTL